SRKALYIDNVFYVYCTSSVYGAELSLEPCGDFLKPFDLQAVSRWIEGASKDLRDTVP
ncbi:hypothetical protein AVEN_164981-1, partial [Araneus ventricosus]